MGASKEISSEKIDRKKNKGQDITSSKRVKKYSTRRPEGEIIRKKQIEKKKKQEREERRKLRKEEAAKKAEAKNAIEEILEKEGFKKHEEAKGIIHLLSTNKIAYNMSYPKNINELKELIDIRVKVNSFFLFCRLVAAEVNKFFRQLVDADINIGSRHIKCYSSQLWNNDKIITTRIKNILNALSSELANNNISSPSHNNSKKICVRKPGIFVFHKDYEYTIDCKLDNSEKTTSLNTANTYKFLFTEAHFDFLSEKEKQCIIKNVEDHQKNYGSINWKVIIKNLEKECGELRSEDRIKKFWNSRLKRNSREVKKTEDDLLHYNQTTTNSLNNVYNYSMNIPYNSQRNPHNEESPFCNQQYIIIPSIPNAKKPIPLRSKALPKNLEEVFTKQTAFEPLVPSRFA
ncbi:hypothetical protein RclHR1_04150002 [Rhizophagus clarus]|uniref:Myb-like domain-containing protein n=1 Tax=Rhizophagus clarus TaxID=94130 RepID=A0A2Z6RFA9_9GLOM|nr:hypothetical protein RclHR1_04150002 [Rhizophagus clarus]GES85628.1 hypothetical protein GLOIN_2v1146758 [Rhizophagus clarus]